MPTSVSVMEQNTVAPQRELLVGSFGLSPSADIIESATRSRKIIEAAESFDIEPVVRRYCRDYEVPADIGEGRGREVKRFLALCALNPRMNYGMYGPVDILWHVFIFFTKNYFEFCERLGGKYLHHVPGSMTPAGHLNPNGYKQMLTDYEYLFGETPPRIHWPLSTKLKASADCVGDTDCNGNCAMDCVSEPGDCVGDCVACINSNPKAATEESA